jgi:CPA1 family monovalent cation:H+ antiporter
VGGSGFAAEEATARRVAAEAALDRLAGLADEYPDHRELVDQLRAGIDHEVEVAALALTEGLDAADRERLDHQEIRLALVSAQREAVIRLRDDGVIGDAALRRVERDLDLQAVRSSG